MTVEPGRVLHYHLLSPLGPWGMGESYRARDTQVGRTVALRLAPDSAFAGAADRAAFLRAAAAAAALSHPNLATLFDAGEYAGGCYLAYEFASGSTLGQYVAGGALHPRRAGELAVQIADAVADAHARGIIHGDLRPETVMVTAKGSAKVLETGMARWTRGGRARRAAQPSPPVPAAGRLAPEEFDGGEPDVRTDVFLLGAMLREMLSGGRSHAFIPQPLAAVTARATSPAPDARHQSMAALAADIRQACAALEQAPGQAPAARVDDAAEQPSRENRGWVAAALAAGAAALLLWWALG